MMANDSKPNEFVTIVMPTLNEEDYIQSALDSITDIGGNSDYEVLVMDGGSKDRTRQMVEDYGATNPRVKLIDNPKRLQSAAVNLAAKIAAPQARVIVRADCHAAYPPGFISQVIRSLRETDSVSVVVPMITKGLSGFQKAIATAQNSLLGNGGSAHRRLGPSRQVEHGHHAAFDRDFFVAIGGYDESFSHNEDAELDFRINSQAGRIWLDTSVPITYYPRSNVKGLARQYFNHGAGRARTFWLHRPPLKLRQMAPLVILFGIIGCGLLSLAWPIFLLPPLAYLILCLGWGLGRAWQSGDPDLAGMGIAAMVMHLGWAVGFLRQSIR
jgi:succinoglycan biosynthesis protein ExoA